MQVVLGGHFWQLGSIASLATETTGGVILVAFWSKHGLRSDLRVPNLKIFLGKHAPRPSSLFSPQWPYQSNIAGSGPDPTVLAALHAKHYINRPNPVIA